MRIPPDAYARLARVAWLHVPPKDEQVEDEDDQRIGRYRLLERLGAGSAGVVFRAVDPEGHVVAVKLLRRRRTRGSRYLREVELLERTAEHEGVVALLDAGRCPKGPFLVLEMAEGGSLRTELTRRKRLPWREATSLLQQVSHALGGLHQEGIIHRDLKPENILLQAGRPLLSDFGLAKDLEGEDGDLTSAGIALGTIGYMSPELLDGDRGQLGPWTDVFALGALLHELAAGHPPFSGKNLREAARSIREDSVKDLPGAPAGLQAILRRCLAKDPGERYPDAAALAQALDAFVAGLPAPEESDSRATPKPALPGERPASAADDGPDAGHS